MIAYGPDAFEEVDIQSLAEVEPYRKQYPVVWIDVIGHGDEELLRTVQESLGLHELAVEDVVNLGQRPKLEEFEENLFCVARMLDRDERGVHSEQLSLFLAEGVVVTFQEHEGDCLDHLRTRIRKGRGRIRNHGADYLFYALLDGVIDGYFPILASVGDRIENIEERVLDESLRDPVAPLHSARRDLLMLRKSIYPLRDALAPLVVGTEEFIQPETRVYFRDAVDHLRRAADGVDAYRDLASSVMDTHLSVVSHRLNDVMALLTIVSTIFIPLSFLVGLWGMNFDHTISDWNMPELHTPYGYPIALVAMFALALAQLSYFRRKGWIGRKD
ncbi:MAG: magnesium transporter [Bradymonadia bacterium]